MYDFTPQLLLEPEEVDPILGLRNPLTPYYTRDAVVAIRNMNDRMSGRG